MVQLLSLSCLLSVYTSVLFFRYTLAVDLDIPYTIQLVMLSAADPAPIIYDEERCAGDSFAAYTGVLIITELVLLYLFESTACAQPRGRR